jgi:hypothetical protein
MGKAVQINMVSIVGQFVLDCHAQVTQSIDKYPWGCDSRQPRQESQGAAKSF